MIEGQQEIPPDLELFDSIEVTALPYGERLYAGYVDGRWPTYRRVVAWFPHSYVIGIATSPRSDALALDVERGDASIEDAPGWVKRQHRRQIKGPILYVQLSKAQQLVERLAAEGILRHHFRLWTAHWTGDPHVCSPSCGLGLSTRAGATQYASEPNGRHYDVSLVAPRFYQGLLAGAP